MFIDKSIGNEQNNYIFNLENWIWKRISLNIMSKQYFKSPLNCTFSPLERRQ